MTRIWSIPGGVHPEENKSQSLQLPLGEIPLPRELVYPLSQHIGAPANAVVTVGDKVLGGQKIAEAKGMISAPIHASTSGTVVAIEDRVLPHPSGMSGPCIVIEADGEDHHVEYVGDENYLQLDRETLIERIRDAGITGMGGAGFPTAVKLNPRADQPIDTLIINGTECEPYITADDILMQTRADEIIKGTELLAHLLGNPDRVVIGIEDNKPAAIEAVGVAAKDSRVEVVSFPTKYPSGGEKQLIQILTGKEVPSGALPASIGIVLQNVGTTVAAYEAVRYGKPLIERITTVVGEALDTQRNIKVRLGTPIQHVLEHHGCHQNKVARLIMGGPMMGFALQESLVPVVKATNCVLVPSKQELPPAPPAQACIRCGMCAEACPASLLPQQMYWYTLAEDYDKLEAHNISDCIECGACSFVCPSNIPLVQYYRSAKGTMRQMAIDKEKSDRSRQRFEFRQERIAKAEAEKEAKRLARKKAAEEAKKKQEAAKAGGKTAPAGNAKADIVAAAMARAQAKPVSPEEQKAKLERAVISAQGRLDKLQTRLQEAEGEMKDKLAAQIKQAEVKLTEAQKKLDDFKPDAASNNSAPNADDPVAAAIARAQAKMTMAPDEKLRANIESLNKRLQKAEEKLSAAQAEGADTVTALQAGVDKLKEKIATAEKELAEHRPVASATAAPAEQDAASAAIERAKAKAAAQANMSPEQKLRDQLGAMGARINKAQDKLQQAQADGADTVDALQMGLDKLQAKQEKMRKELRVLNPSAPELSDADNATGSTPTSEEAPQIQDAATAAIEKAKAKAAAQASMSPEEKLRDQIESLEKRLQKAQQRLAKAEAEDDDNIDAFRAGVEKTQAKLEQTRAQLENS